MYAMYLHVGLLMLLTQSFVLTAFVCGVLFGFGHCTESEMSEMSRTHEAPSLTLHKYTAKQLVDLKPPGKLNLPWQTWASIRDTGIGMKGPTRRGKRAGKTPYIASTKSPFVPDCPISIPTPQPLVRKATPNGKFTLCHMNCQSARNKISSIVDHITENDIDFVALTESWFKDTDQRLIEDVKPDGYDVRHFARADRIGGGVTIIFKSSISVLAIKDIRTLSFEGLSAVVQTGELTVKVIVIYRLHPYGKSGVIGADFFNDFEHIIDQTALNPGHVLFLGDYNIHYDCDSEPECRRLKELLITSNLKQHVTEPTHTSGHILDLVISKDDKSVESVSVSSMISDHFAVHVTMAVSKPRPLRKTIHYRKYRSIDLACFSQDLATSSIVQSPAKSLDDLVHQYNTVISDVVNKHAPKLSRKLAIKPYMPWYNTTIQMAKRTRRQLERRWRKTKLVADRDAFKKQRETVNNLIDQAKAEYYRQKIAESSGNQSSLFRIVDSLYAQKDQIGISSKQITR